MTVRRTNIGIDRNLGRGKFRISSVERPTAESTISLQYSLYFSPSLSLSLSPAQQRRTDGAVELDLYFGDDFVVEVRGDDVGLVAHDLEGLCDSEVELVDVQPPLFGHWHANSRD